jgi:hypothetical protein
MTRDQKKSGIDPIYLASGNMPHIVGKFLTRVTTFFQPHRDRRSAKEVMRPQSPGSPCWRDFGTPTRESRERKVIWMQAPWRVTEYIIRGKVVACPSPGRGESSESKVARGSS